MHSKLKLRTASRSRSATVHRGSRKHVLDWTAQPSVLTELSAMLNPAPVRIPADSMFMPRGHEAPREARLETFGPLWKPGDHAWATLSKWWLKYEVGANTPNWDLVVGCEIEGASGLVLVEAKANWPELGLAGKPLSAKASARSHENHAHIGKAIQEACAGWRSIDPRVDIAHTSHYQLANRLAFTWKLATLGIPVILVYLGFTGDEGIRDAGQPFADHDDWQQAFDRYTEAVAPKELFDCRHPIKETPVWLLSRSRAAIENSPPRSSS